MKLKALTQKAGIALLSVMALGAAGAAAAATSDADLIAKGKYLTRAGDCVSCHTVMGGQPFAGGHALETPFGTIYSPNITPDDKTGIGTWTFKDFWMALHYGKGENGKLLYPAFSYTSFTNVTMEDAKAIYAYLQSLPPVRQENKPHELNFPYNVRKLLVAWRALYFTPGVYEPNPKKSDEWNRGAYLVQGLGHCNECHTSRNFLGAMNEDTPLAGGELPMHGWYAPNLSMKEGGGLEGWTTEDLVELLKTGFSDKGGVFGPMADVVRNSTQYMTRDDLRAIATYLKSLPAPAKKQPTAKKKAANYDAGKAIYAKQCDGCHGKDGKGNYGVYPPLANNSTVTEPSGINAIRSVLLGGFPPATKGNPFPYSMPPFAGDMSNEDVAAVVNYIRQSWGNDAVAVTAKDVAKSRSKPAL